jgi:5-hydroxyisourate hydrolase
MSGRLTTHVLDTSRGRPAAGVRIELWRVDAQGAGRTLIREAFTNQDGRTDSPLLEGDAFAAGCYEIVFSVGEYFTSLSGRAAAPPFLDRVPVRFGIADPSAHYHVPLLASPWAYSTYRGS